MRTPTVPPASRDTDKWLEWLADQPCLTDAIDTAKDNDIDYQIVAYAVGRWIAEHRQDQVAERIAAEFVRLNELVKR